MNEVLTAEEWKRRFEKEKEKNSKLRSKLAQYELGAIPAPKGLLLHDNPSPAQAIS